MKVLADLLQILSGVNMQLSLHMFAWNSGLLPVRSAEWFGPVIGSTRRMEGVSSRQCVKEANGWS